MGVTDVQLAGGEFSVCRLIQSQRAIALHLPFDGWIVLAGVLSAMLPSRLSDLVLIATAVALQLCKFIDAKTGCAVSALFLLPGSEFGDFIPSHYLNRLDGGLRGGSSFGLG